MQRQIDESIQRVRQSLLEMAGIVEEMIADSERAVVTRDALLGARVIRVDSQVDQLEKTIDELCLVALALHEPKASDFRFLVAAQKIVGDLERMGDAAVNMAQAAIQLAQEPPLEPYVDVPRLGAMVRAMVQQGLDALVRKDAVLAREVRARDAAVDALYQQLFRDLVGRMVDDRRGVRRSLQHLLVAKNLERVADHATNIAEDVIYYLEGRDVRHSAPVETT
jgi:phosphate transport system protein